MPSFVQDDVKAFEELAADFLIKLAHHRTSFLSWSISKPEENTEHTATWQTDFWKPAAFKVHNVMRAGFGLEYLVLRRPTVPTDGFNGTQSKRRSHEEDEDHSSKVPEARLQRLSVYIQLKKPHAKPPAEPAKGTIHPNAIPRQASFTLENTMIIFDSMHKDVSADELIPGKRSWQQLPDEFDLVDSTRGNSIAFATVQMIFNAIAEKWSSYILSMHNYIVSLEEVIYEQPANDERAPELWNISKQLLQAERLIKLHILLLENVQNDFLLLVEPTVDPNWLEQSLKEYVRLGSQVEETLRKPIAHMVDLASHIRPCSTLLLMTY